MTRALALFDADLEQVAQRARSRLGQDLVALDRSLIRECHPKQAQLVADPHRRVTALCGRGAGKTTALKVRYLRRMLHTQRARCLYVATTRDQAIDLLWEPIKEICDRFSIQFKPNETRLSLRLPHNGSTLRLVGADDKRQIEKYRGQPFHEVWVDEAASYPAALLESLLDRIIGPRLGDFGGMLGMVGTPGHILRGPFYDATRPGSEEHRRYEDRDQPEYAGWLNWSFHQWSLLDGAPYIPALASLWREALLQKENKGWSDDNPVWKREYLGQWAADDTQTVFRYRPFSDDGKQWNQWSPNRDNPLRFAELPKERTDWEYGYGMDLGSSDPTAVTVWAYSPTDPSKTLYHVWEHEQRGMYARTIATLLKGDDLESDRLGGVLGRTGWPVGFVADRDGNGDAILRELAHVYGIAIEPADKKNYMDSIELFNGDLVDGRIKVMAGSKLEEQLQNQQWAIDEDSGKLKKHKGQRDDLTDSAIYIRRKMGHLFAEPAKPPPPQFPAALDPRSEWSEKPKEPEFDYGRHLDDDELAWG